MINVSVVELENEKGTLKSFRLETVADNSTLEITRRDEKSWRVRVKEPNGTVSVICFSADSEISASITAD